MKFISLFAGIGGFDLGLERAGMECVAQVEIDPFCQKVLQKHWPDVPKFGDVRNVGRHNLPTSDLICGGFPCQPHSVAGKRRGAKDDRDLWPEYRRIIDECRPRWVLAENVPGIRTTILDQVLSDLEGMDYTTRTLVVPACAFDAPHRRERIFIIASLDDTKSGGRGLREAENVGQTAGDINPSCNPSSIQSGIVAHANGRRREQRNQEQRGIPELDAGSWWAVEPDLGRVVTRFSNELDGGLDGHELCIAQARTAGIPKTYRLRKLREYIETTKTSSRQKRCAYCGHPLSSLPCQGACNPWYVGGWIKESENLRCMQEGVLGLLTQQGENVQPYLSLRAWEVERPQALGQRVDRLRSLGNAVVPQVVEWLGRMIVEVDHERTI